MRLVGVDGCADGWVVAASDERLDSVDFTVLARLDELFAQAKAGDALVVIDMPIGLTESGPRPCDIAARGLLGAPRNSSVFPAPNRPTLHATDYLEACALNVAASGKALSKQAFAILLKIREIDGLMTPALQDAVREAHPEVSFAVLAGGRGLAFSKRGTGADRTGEEERIGLLARYLWRFDAGAVRSGLRPKRVQRDDIVDAAVCLVTAYRVSRGEHTTLPDGEPVQDARGLRMEMVA